MPPKRKKLEREADMVIVANLYRKSWTIRQIAEEITRRRPYSVSYVTIKHDLDRILKRWRKKQEAYIEDFVAINIQQIQLMKKEAWSEYLRSKSPKKKIVEKRNAIVKTGIHNLKSPEEVIDLEMDHMFKDSTSSLEDINKRNKSIEDIEIQFTDLSTAVNAEVDQTVQVEERLGNPKYLELVAKLMDQEARLLGFYNADNNTSSETTVIVKLPEKIDQKTFIPRSLSKIKLDETLD